MFNADTLYVRNRSTRNRSTKSIHQCIVYNLFLFNTKLASLYAKGTLVTSKYLVTKLLVKGTVVIQICIVWILEIK